MSDEPDLTDDMDICIGLLMPALVDAMQALRAKHPQLPLPAFAGAAANALRLVAMNEVAVNLASPEVDWSVPRMLSSKKLDMIAEFVLAMRGGAR